MNRPAVRIDRSIARFSEANFRRFEHDLFMAVSTYPRGITFTPTNMALTTFRLNFFGAMHSFLDPACPFTTNKFTRRDIERLRAEYILTFLPSENFLPAHIRYAPRGQAVLPPPVHSVNTSNVIGDVIDGTDLDFVNAIAICKSRGLFTGQVSIRDLPDYMASDIERNYPNLTVFRDDSRDGITIIF